MIHRASQASDTSNGLPVSEPSARSWPSVVHRASASLCVFFIALSLLVPGSSQAQETLLKGGWQLDSSASSIKFQSIKNGSTVETSRFANFDGTLDENGLATLLIELNSVDTAVDLRNVRMRFLFFETFRYPIATVSAQISDSTLHALAAQRRIKLPVTFELDLHGVTQSLSADTVLTQFTDDQISVTSSSPVNIKAEQFNLMEGIIKLQEAANVTIVPSGSVSFDLTFKRNTSAAADTESSPAQTVAQPAATTVTSSAATAVETTGNFSVEECQGRFDILSQTGAINFAFGSSELDANSFPLLDTLIGIIQRCPGLQIVVEGHTDSTGSEATNQYISGTRAQSVTRYLMLNGVPADRIRAVGFGESSPLVPNDSARNRARNRRIEFTIEN